MIRLQNISVRYNEHTPLALNNISVAFQEGEAVSIMGANGSGKSTFAKLVAGLIKPYQGRLDIDNHSDKPLPVGIIFQNPDNQMVAVTVEKELAFALENLGYPQQKMSTLIDKTLENFSISHLRYRLTTELSGGEKQKIALASVMIFQPDILILDEPDSFLDEKGKAVLQKELTKIKEQKPNLILIHITQYPSIARQYERMLVFDNGGIKADGNPDDIFNDKKFCLDAKLLFSFESEKQMVIPSYPKDRKVKEKTLLKSIVFKEVGFEYFPNERVIKNLCCTLDKEEIIGVVGLSGTGKSTFGHLICHLLKPTHGKIKYLNQKGEQLAFSDMSGKVSGAFQQPERQFFLPTCKEEISFGPKNMGYGFDKEMTVSFLNMVGLPADKFITRDPFTLSGGEKRRLAFAAILSMFPDFVVFDEPTCGLDPEGVGRFILLAKALQKAKTGVVIISHDGNVIKKLADRIILFRKNEECSIFRAEDFFRKNNIEDFVSPVSPYLKRD
ncbi:MAG: ATP-binding cassette domain-containing protein [FCB group bacterium]|nr:ATP-binding cassette domain-containing protein [FCB group bacterium]